jgi:hypothetical protein
MARASYIRWDEDDDFFSANPLKHSATLFWFRVNQYLLLLLSDAYLAEKQQISFFIVFGMSQQGHESLRSNAHKLDTLTIPMWRYWD